jgi:hypothetical protein
MMQSRFSRIALLLALTIGITSGAVGDDEKKGADLKNFIRIRTDRDGQDLAQLSIRTYRRNKNSKKPSTGMPFMGKAKPFKYPEILLISIVHFAEGHYYNQVSKTLAGCDLVLYEAMGYDLLKGQPKAKEDPWSLVFQGSAIKKTKTWQLADLSLNAQQQALGIPKAQMDNQLKQMNRMIDLMGEKTFRSQLINQFKQMQGMDKLMAMKFILLQRNSVAFGKIVESIYNSKAKKIAVLYGGAHMPDLEKRLKNELDYSPVKTKWLNAIHKTKKAAQNAKKKPRLY